MLVICSFYWIPSIVELKTNIQKCVTDVHEWYESNKLVTNTSKSNVMLLTTRQMLSHMTYTDLNVHIGNHEFHQCSNINYLGVDIDNVLSWDSQTDTISKKLIFIISRLPRLNPVLFKWIELNWIELNVFQQHQQHHYSIVHSFVKKRTNIEVSTQLTCSVNTVIYLHDNL